MSVDRTRLGLDIGSNSVGSSWLDPRTQAITVGVSIFPAGVDESDEKRGDPKNLKRRRVRRTRITLARKAQRKRLLRLKLIAARLLPDDAAQFAKLLNETDPWVLRRDGLSRPLEPHEFGRILLHMAQRRGAVGFDADIGDKGKVKSAITNVQLEMLRRFGSEDKQRDGNRLRESIKALGSKARTSQEESELEKAHDELKRICRAVLQDASVTFGRFIADLRDERRTPITSPDRRRQKRGVREWRAPIRNRQGRFEFHADRAMIRDEFAKLWAAQQRFGGRLADLLGDELRQSLDDESGDTNWRHRGLLFGQRRTKWDTGTLGRCVLEPSERCVPHADMYASRYRMVETVNNLKIVERGKQERALTPAERGKIIEYLSGPLGVVTKGKQKGQPKRTATVTDLRELMGWSGASKASPCRFTIENDEEREINTDWFCREIIHGAVTKEKWDSLSESTREGFNRAILNCDPDEEADAERLRLGATTWGTLSDTATDALLTAWKKRPRPDAKRLNMSRRAVRNLLAVMDRAEPWPDPQRPDEIRWLTQIAARKHIAADKNFADITSGKPLNAHAKRRYETGAKGATAKDRHYMRKHILTKNGQPIISPDGELLSEPPPAPLVSNPVVRRALHEVRRHLIEYMKTFERKPDEVYVELSREAKMGKKDADEALLRNRLRARIKNDILATFKLDSVSSTQQNEAVRRVVLSVQQNHVCPLCGKGGLTARLAAEGAGCEIAHIVPRGVGGDNGWKNIVLAHTECNRIMGRRTPRQFWSETLKGGYEEGVTWTEKIYTAIERPKFSELQGTSGNSLWACYFNWRDDQAKLAQFKKDVKDIQAMTERQGAATKYATRQVMAYLADALYGGNGLPERGGTRLIYATDGLWTARLRREWGLFFDPHGFKAGGLTNTEEHIRKEKDRGDHRHHAIDAVVTALCTREVQAAWEVREKRADEAGVNTADEEAMRRYRRDQPLVPPAPFKSCDELRAAVRRAIFGKGEVERPVCHRPVKRKLIGALHEESLFGPVLGPRGELTESYTAKKGVLELKANHLRLPVPEAPADALKRLTQDFKTQGLKPKEAKTLAERILSDPAYKPRMIDPSPEKSGIVRDIALRKRLRDCLSEYRYVKKNKNGEPTGEAWNVNPNDFSENEMKQAYEAGQICHESGVPIRSVVLLRTMKECVVVSRFASRHATGERYPLYDSATGTGNGAAARAYVGGNNHHIEIRASKNKKGDEVWSGDVVSAYEAARRKLAKHREFRQAGIPKPAQLRKLKRSERDRFKPLLRAAEQAHPIVNRTDDEEKGGKFIMSLSEGETLFMRHKETQEVGYFIVAEIVKEKKQVVLVPHWDARTATERKNAEGMKVTNSSRDQFNATPNDLRTLAPPSCEHAVKVRVSPLGRVIRLSKD